MAPQTVADWCHCGRMVRVHGGVYALGHRQISARALAAAAVLACGPTAVLSHDSAAALWGLRRWPQRPEVTAPEQHRRPGIRSHRSTTLSSRDIRRHHGIRVTSPARTIADVAPRLTDRRLIRVVNDARVAKHLTPAQLHRLLTSCPRARRLIDPDHAPTRSDLEDDFVAFTRCHGLPTPQTNVVVLGYEVDALFEEQKVIVELDGWEFHQDRATFESDRERDATTALHGYATIRITHPRIHAQETREADRLRAILARRTHG
jgi:hypothetical protein